MAEVAGLTVGVIALAGLFNDCLDTISHISAIRSMGRDARILSTKLDVEKTLFLQWAESVRLLHSDCDVRLRNDFHAKAIEDVLRSLKTLLKDSSEIQTRYGLRRQTQHDATASGSNVISGSRMAKFTAAFEQHLSLLHTPQAMRRERSSQSIASRVRWVAVDKEKFERLIDDLSHFVSKLNELVPAVDSKAKAKAKTKIDRGAAYHEALSRLKDFSDVGPGAEEAEAKARKIAEHYQLSESHTILTRMADNDIASIDSAEDLLGLVEMEPDLAFAEGSLERYIVRAAKARYGSLCGRILNALWFRRIDDRRQCISPAHSRTLEWALSPPAASDSPWADLAEWFRHGSGFYWISGKAGCGKSTLMRHLSEHETVKELLCDWAADSRLITTSFFYYHLGTAEQKTHEGLTRTLLHRVLEVNRPWIPYVLPGMWKEATRSKQDHQLDLPTPAETRAAFDKLSQMPAKMCLFIDGLDEHLGNHQDSISFIKTMISGGNAKVLVSSRPEPDFISAFSRGPMLRMHDLTKGDIEKYVADHVGSHPHMQSLMRRKSIESRARQIVADLVEKAEGIFLWIVLACRSVLVGLVMGDRIGELEDRVEELPRELGNMFCHMLRKVEDRYRPQGVKYLRICHEAYKSTSIIQAFNSQQDNLVDGIPYKLPTASLSILDEYHEDLMGCSVLGAISASELDQICQTFAHRINSRCGGLLEIRLRPADEHRKTALGKQKYLLFELAVNPQTTYDPILDSEVVFMHRTVAEFLDDTSPWNLDGLDFSNNTCHPLVSLSCLWMYTAQFSDPEGPYFGSSIEASLFHAAKAASDGGDFAMIPMLSAFQEIFQHFGWSETALTMAAQLGVVEFVRDYFDKHTAESVSERPDGLPLLYHALSYSIHVPSFGKGVYPFGDVLSPGMVEYLLQQGCRAMEMFCPTKTNKTTATSPWAVWVERLSRDKTIHLHKRIAITQLFLTTSSDRDAIAAYTEERSESLFPTLQKVLLFRPEKMQNDEYAHFWNQGWEIMRVLFGSEIVSEEL
ncbi:prion-inhibition and propagation-domain-containing protein [Cercophora newfieldiana]|uniref:Prion-inhibition and propagation-domain-containing protein n=1 Tax=Cercophora newfieldiana TaxID=92897 RepID=A0AA39Y6U8_9PEZI|nr:prion-inhibition and propagation-domain-containing protein [Cercophora newfieldiana]